MSSEPPPSFNSGRDIPAEDLIGGSHSRRGGKVLSALTYNALAVAPAQGLSFLRSVVLARLLTPEAFGLFGLASMSVAALSAVSNLNLKTLLVTLPLVGDDSRKQWLDGVWVVEVIRSGIIFVAASALASPMADFYGNPKLYSLLIIAASAAFIDGFANSAFTLYERDIEYKRVVIVEQLTALVSFCVTVGLTFWRRDATVFVWGLVSASGFKVAMSYLWHKRRPSWRLDPTVLRRCLNLGKYFLIVSFLTYLTTQFDNLFIGKYMGAAPLGIYLVAYKLAMMPVDVMMQVVGRVAVPAYARLYRESPTKAFDLWSVNSVCLGWVFAASALVLWAGGDGLISLLYGPGWHPQTHTLQLLIGAGFFRGMAHASGALVQAMSRPDVDARAKVVETLVFVSLVIGLVPRFGMLGAACAGLVCYALAFAFRTAFLFKTQPSIVAAVTSGFSRLALVIAAAVLFDSLLVAASAPVLVRAGLVPTIAFCCGIVFEPQLRRQLSATLVKAQGSAVSP